MSQITKSNLDFLIELSQNNDREWFQENKPRFIKEQENIISFADKLLELMNVHDSIETLNGKKSLYRIYRDIRFSKDKSPYKTNWAGGFKRATKLRRGGYYFNIQPGDNSFIGGGFWSPNKEDLLRIREDIANDASEMREIINSKDFVTTFGNLEGDQLKTSPKGFDKEHPDVDLLRYKQFIFGKKFSDEEVLSKNFVLVANETFKSMRPFFDYMSDVLTTDSNGSPLF
ncbi:MAG: DUF2461 domain-containing protein [Crocinitomicaceae bacterium]|nr:DUF2461 domain-containing protein [Crocinitomicaceae bacterium]